MNNVSAGVFFRDANLTAGWGIDDVAVNSTAAELNLGHGLTAGTAAASKFLLLDANKRAATLGAFTWGEVNTYFGQTSITAHAGGGQGSAFALTGEYNLISTVATAGDSVILPAGALGKPMRVKVSAAAAAAAAVFPPSGGTINGLSANASMTLQPGSDMLFWATSATAWHCEGGVNPAVGFTFSPVGVATLGAPPITSTQGTDTTPSITEAYAAQVNVPCTVLCNGISILNGSANAGNAQAWLCDSTGALVSGANSASTAQSGTSAMQDLTFATPVTLRGPATYFIVVAFGNVGARFRTHAFGRGAAFKLTGATFGTPAAITSVLATTFTAGQGPVAVLI